MTFSDFMKAVLGSGTPRKIVLTDLNGPWVNGNATHYVITHLVLDKNLPRSWAYEAANHAMQDYRLRRLSYGEAVQKVKSAYDDLTRGKPKKETSQMIEEYISSGNVPIHPYCEDLAKAFKDANRLIVGVSTSTDEIAIPLAKRLGFDHIICTPHGIDDSQNFTKISDPLIGDQRYGVIREFKANAKNIDWTNSVGIGNTPNDVAIFDHTDIKWALNPDAELRDLVKQIRRRGDASWYISPDCDDAAASILETDLTSGAEGRIRVVENGLVEKYGKKAFSKTCDLPVEHREIIEIGNLISVYGNDNDWPADIVALFSEKVARPAYAINTDSSHPCYNGPGRLAFTAAFDELWKKIPETVKQKLEKKK